MTAARASGAPHAAPYSLEINGFRGICVLLVFLHHVANSRLPPPPDAASFWQVGLMNLFLSFGYGVELFFMISGYVIVNSLRRHATVSGFLYDRVLRIFPVWLPIGIVLCIGAALAGRSGFVDGFSSTWVVHSAVNLALLAPLVSLPMVHPASWSLTYEWIFYLASALAALAWRRPALEPRPALRLAWVLWALAVALLIACFPRGLFFLPGVLVALWPDRLRPLQRWPVLAVAALPVFLLTWLSTGIFAAEYGLPLWAVVANGHGPAVLVALAAGTLVFACVATPNAQGLGVLRSRAMQHLGTISYSFYLVHPVVMAVVKQGVVRWMPEAYGSWPATIVFALVSAALAWPLSHLSWQWGEQRLARWLRSLRSVNDAQARQQPLNHRGA